MTGAESFSPILPAAVEQLVRFEGGQSRHRVERFGAIGRGPVRIASMRVALEMLDEVV